MTASSGAWRETGLKTLKDRDFGGFDTFVLVHLHQNQRKSNMVPLAVGQPL